PPHIHLSNQAPDATAILANHGLTRLTAEGFGEIGIVLQGAVHSVTAGRMRVSLGQQPGTLRGAILAPDLGKPKEESLFWSESLDRLIVGRVRRFAPLVVQVHQSNPYSSVIGRIFPEGQAAVQVHFVNCADGTIPTGHEAGPFSKSFRLLA